MLDSQRPRTIDARSEPSAYVFRARTGERIGGVPVVIMIVACAVSSVAAYALLRENRPEAWELEPAAHRLSEDLTKALALRAGDVRSLG
jgi:hypothetical protein